MIILHIVSNLTPGGAELMMKRLIRFHLDDGGFQHHVISLREKSSVGAQLEAMGVKVTALGMTGALSAPFAIIRLVAKIRLLKPDVVQTWMYHADLIGGIAARLAGVRNVIWGVRATYLPHGQGTAPATTAVRSACAFISSRVPRYIVYVAESARLVHERLGYQPEKSFVIPNGYEMPTAPLNKEARHAARLKLGLPQGALIVGSAGRYNALKDYPTFIAVAAQLAQDRSELHFALAGRGLTEENAELMGLIQSCGLEERVHLLGEQQDLTAFMAAIDVFCLHSISEGFPNVVAEAMAMAVPCAVTDVGAAALIVGETGITVPQERPELLTKALKLLICEGEEVRRQRGGRARERIAAQFAIDAIVAKYELLYAGVTHSCSYIDDARIDCIDAPSGPLQR